MTAALRELVASDVDELCALNNAAVPAVPITSHAEMAALLEVADHAFGWDDGGTLLGFLLAMEPGAAYDSENYRYFEARGIDHLYVDRIVVDERSRGSGVGRRLYERAFSLARAAGRREVTCEVNVDPPNPRSLAFHARLGFLEVGRQRTKGDTVGVALLAASV